jgi:glycosyltransferase involved in cell wall biosynthesis
MALEGRRALFISYNGMLDPLGQSQVIPYLRELAKRGMSFTLLSFERAGAFESDGIARCKELRSKLASEKIQWHWLRYHQKPSLPATIYDVLAGIRYGSTLVRRNKIEILHARSHIPATISLALKKRFELKMIFDLRGLLAEEYVEAEHWSKSSIPYRLTKSIERRALAASEGVVTLTEKIWSAIENWEGLRGRQLAHEVIPCCADLELFKFRFEDRKERRAELGLEDRFTIVYSGSIGGWYLSDKLANFFVQLLKQGHDAHFLWLTPGDPAIIRTLMDARDIKPARYTVRSPISVEVPSYLSASDLGVAFYKPGFSKLATSPVKVTEYLACGLPFVINTGIGDLDTLVTNERLGAVVDDFTESEYAKAIATIEQLTPDQETIRARARAAAERFFDIRKVGVERYERLYEQVLAARAAEAEN